MVLAPSAMGEEAHLLWSLSSCKPFFFPFDKARSPGSFWMSNFCVLQARRDLETFFTVRKIKSLHIILLFNTATTFLEGQHIQVELKEEIVLVHNHWQLSFYELYLKVIDAYLTKENKEIQSFSNLDCRRVWFFLGCQTSMILAKTTLCSFNKIIVPLCVIFTLNEHLCRFYKRLIKILQFKIISQINSVNYNIIK